MTPEPENWEERIIEIVKKSRKQNWKNGGVLEYNTPEIEQEIRTLLATIRAEGVAEGKAFIGEENRKAYQRGVGDGAREMHLNIEEKLKYDLFPVQVREENPSYWNGYTDTIFKIKDIISAITSVIAETKETCCERCLPRYIADAHCEYEKCSCHVVTPCGNIEQ